MNNSTQYSLNLNNLQFVHGDFTSVDYWFDMICESGGFSNDNQWMIFKSDGIEVVVDFELTVSGKVTHDPGDYWTAPYTDYDYEDISVSVTSLHIDDWSVELNSELKSLFEIEIKKHL